MIFEKNNNSHKLSLKSTKMEDIDLEELSDIIRKQNEKNVASAQNTQQIKKVTTKKEPDPYVMDTSEDRASKLGKFGWYETEGTFVPYLTRLPDNHLVSKRMAEVKVLKGSQEFFSWDLFSCMYLNLIPATAAEANLLNDINKNHSDNCYGPDYFKQGDPLILLADLTEMISFLRYCCTIFGEHSEYKEKPCGFMEINHETVPYVFVDYKMYLPLFYFDGDIKVLEQKAVEISGWNAAYIRLLCKVQGVRKEFFELPSIACVNIDYLKMFFVPGTPFNETWPCRNKLSYRASKTPDPLRNTNKPPQILPQVVARSNQPPYIQSPVSASTASQINQSHIPTRFNPSHISSQINTSQIPSMVNPSPSSPSSIKAPRISPSSQVPPHSIPRRTRSNLAPNGKAPKKSSHGISKATHPHVSPTATPSQKSSHSLSKISQSHLHRPSSVNTPQMSSKPVQSQPYLAPSVNTPHISSQKTTVPSVVISRPYPNQFQYMQNISSYPSYMPNIHHTNAPPPPYPYYNRPNSMNFCNKVPSRHPVIKNRFYEPPPSNESISSFTIDPQPPTGKYNLQRAVLTNDAALIDCINNGSIEASGIMLYIDSVAKVYFGRPVQYVMKALTILKIRVYQPDYYQCGMISVMDVRRNLRKLLELLK